MLKELYDEPITEDEFAQLVERPSNQLGITEIRRLMIRLRQIADKERPQLKDLRDAVISPYNERLSRYDDEEKKIREKLQAFVVAYGNASFPDVGTSYLITQQAKVEVVDNTKAKAWAKENGFVKEEPDVTAAKNEIQKNGEVPPPESGMEWVPEHQTLGVRTTS